MTDVSSPNLFFIALEYIMPSKMTGGGCELWILCALNYKLRNTNRQTHHYMHTRTNTSAHNSPDANISVVCALKQVISSVFLLSVKLRQEFVPTTTKCRQRYTPEDFHNTKYS